MIQNEIDKIQRIQSERKTTIISNNSLKLLQNRTPISPFTAYLGNLERIKLIYESDHAESEQNLFKSMKRFDLPTICSID